MALLLLLVMVVASSVLVYHLVTSGYLASTSPAKPSHLVVDACEVEGRLFTIYVRNVGESPCVITSAYLCSLEGEVVAELTPAVLTSSSEIWGGDVWRPDGETLSLVRVVKGCIVDDDFTSRDPSTWDDSYVDYNNDWSRVYYDPDSLKLLSESADGWAVRGLITVDRLVDLSASLVIEVDLEKTTYNVPDGDAAASPFAACLYLSLSNDNPNPYFNIPWFAAKLYPRSFLYRTEAQLVTRSSAGIVDTETLYTWYSSPGTAPRGVFLLFFNETGKVYYYFWRGARVGPPYRSGSWSSTTLNALYGQGPLFIYLSIDNRVAASSRKAHIRYLQAYRGSKLRLQRAGDGWTLELTDASWNTVKRVYVEGGSASIDLTDIIVSQGMPFNGHLKLYTYNASEFEAYDGWQLMPGQCRGITVASTSAFTGTYLVKVVASDGSTATTIVKLA